VAQEFRRRVDFCGGGSHSPAIMKALSDRLRTVATRPVPTDDRNPGMPLDLDVVRALRVNRSAVERRAATIPTRRTVKKEWQAAWLLRAITCMDLTTLQGDDTPGNVLRLCAKARRPLRPDLVEALGVGHLDIKVGAVCVYHALVPTAVAALAGSGIPVAAVSTDFPQVSIPSHNGCRKCRRPSRPARRRSTSSSRARTCLPVTGPRCMPRCARSATRAGGRT